MMGGLPNDTTSGLPQLAIVVGTPREQLERVELGLNGAIARAATNRHSNLQRQDTRVVVTAAAETLIHTTFTRELAHALKSTRRQGAAADAVSRASLDANAQAVVDA